jgi:DNA-binding ferritin-like protein (Dps family)
MAEVLIRDEQIARRLFDIAAREERSVEAVLEELIDLYEARPLENPLLKMAAAADKLGLTADHDDISEHFDALLRDTWDKTRDGESGTDEHPERADR